MKINLSSVTEASLLLHTPIRNPIPKHHHEQTGSHHYHDLGSTRLFRSAGRNGILNVIKIDSCQAARGRRSSQHEIDRRKLAERQRESEQRMIQACGKDQVYADH